MKEAFEKIVERLEEELHLAEEDAGRYEKGNSNHFKYAKARGYATSMDVAIEIVNQVAEEYAEKEFSEWCHDCPAYDKENHHCPRWCKVIRTVVEEIKEGYNREWIPCSERLPELKNSYTASESVLVTDIKGSIWTAEYHENGIWLDDVCDIRLGVIAWQPLPEPYKPKGE